MIPAIEKILQGHVVIKPTTAGWKINSLGTDVLDWMRHNYKDEENESWQVWYYSGSMTIIEVIDEKIMTMLTLRWL
jgi:hypothetical protein